MASGTTTAQSETSVKQPQWHKPSPATTVPAASMGLRVYNSLTRNKEEFVPVNGKRVTWYTCGPTVYDAAHMGHARSYITFDILRRIMEDYFGFEVMYVMNITDIDDKNYLLQQYKETQLTLSDQVISDIQKAWIGFAQSKIMSSPALESALKDVNGEQLLTENYSRFKELVLQNQAELAASVGEKFSMYMKSIEKTQVALDNARHTLKTGKCDKETVDGLIDDVSDIIVAYLDKMKGSEVRDNRLFQELPSFWEGEFMKDMQALNVRPADVLTRVSEYVPEIVDYVQKIIGNGYAYEADGSVYFDVDAFKKKHDYAKLSPWSAGHAGLLEEGEGCLTSALRGKKSSFDFALWKASKPGEPSWPSPWGNGRPGWHIECSVMASSILGSNMDIHSGGIDLCFPHHDNEMAQSEAYYGCKQWVNYFFHAGHLHIEGQKMSKSLKNFITIQEALKDYTGAQIRMMFLLHSWESTLDYKTSSMLEAVTTEKTIKNFCENVKAFSREAKMSKPTDPPTHNYREAEHQLAQKLAETEDQVRLALCDNFDTPATMTAIMELINRSNSYIKEKMSSKQLPNVMVLERVAKYITRMLKIFGIVDSRSDEIGYPSNSGDANGSAESVEDKILPYLNALSLYRDSVRDLAKQKKGMHPFIVYNFPEHKEFLILSDRLRDQDLPKLGLALEDREDGRSLIKFVSQEELAAKKKLEDDKTAEKQKQAEQLRQKRLERLERGRPTPQQLFQTAEFSKWDDQGAPTHDAQGEELNKSRKKKIAKEWEAQEKLHRDFLQAVEKGELS